jgi:hypothetical protein
VILFGLCECVNVIGVIISCADVMYLPHVHHHQIDHFETGTSRTSFPHTSRHRNTSRYVMYIFLAYIYFTSSEHYEAGNLLHVITTIEASQSRTYLTYIFVMTYIYNDFMLPLLCLNVNNIKKTTNPSKNFVLIIFFC